MATREFAFSQTRPTQASSLSPRPPSPPRTPTSPTARVVQPFSRTEKRDAQYPSSPRSPILKRKAGLCNLGTTNPAAGCKSPLINKGSEGLGVSLTHSESVQNSSRPINADNQPSPDRYSHSQVLRTTTSPVINFSRPISRSAESTFDRKERSEAILKHYRSASTQGVGQSGRAKSSHSDITTNFLSRFPIPPTSTDPSDPNSADSRDEPRTPTVYHFRGASFEFVNPRHSLAIQNIETPAEQEPDRFGYFSGSGKERFHRANANLPPMKPTLLPAGMDRSGHRTTPPRSLFDDLPSAYNSIRRMQSSSPTQNLQIATPPQPALENSKPKTKVERLGSRENLIEKGSVSRPSRWSPANSLKKRFSEVFRLHGRDIDVPNKEETSTTYGHPTSCEYNGQRNHDSSHGRLIGSERVTGEENSLLHPHRNWLSAATEQVATPRYSDALSVPSPVIIRSRSTSYHLAEFQQPGRESLYSTDSADDPSNEDLIASYGYEFGPNTRYSTASALQRHRSMPLFDTRNSTPTTNKQADSTIGEILEQYHHHDASSVEESKRPSFQEQVTSAGSGAKSTTEVTHEEALSFGPSCGVKDKENELEESNVINGPNKSIRAATARALNAPSTAPLQPLPEDPSCHLRDKATGVISKGNSRASSDLSAPSYSDTRHLLLLSQTSTELGRGNAQETSDDSQHGKESIACSENSRRHLLPSHSNSPADVNSRRTSDRSYEEILNRDIRYLRRWSGLSEFQGSVYMVGSSSSVQGRHADVHNPSKVPSTRARVGQSDLRKSATPVQASYLPVAAFQQSAVIPGIRRLPTADRALFEGSQNASNIPIEGETEEELSVYSEDGTESGFDWETLPDSHATLSVHQTNEDSLAQWSSDSSLNTFRNVGVHPGDSRLQHEYKLHSPDASDAPILIPDYKFCGSPGFPNRNALAPPAPAIYNTYKHPIPLSQTHENPFTSSPPQIAGNHSKNSPGFGPSPHTIRSVSSTKDENIPLVRLGGNDVSVTPEQSPETPITKKSFGLLDGIRKLSNSANLVKSTTKDSSSELLSSGPGPEISLEAQDGSPADSEKRKHRPRSAKLSSGVDPGLVHILRQGDPRMASSPLSAANSFARMSHLGPKANITGTPNGTGMREVGSSLVGSSSPAAAFGSSPPIAHDYTPLTITSTIHQTHESSSAFQASSPLAKFHSSPRDLSKQTDTDDRRRGTSFRDALIAEGRAERHARRAVNGQRHLIQMTLKCDEESTATSGLHPSHIKEDDPGREIHEQLLPLPATNSSLPKLRHRYRSPSSRTSYTRDRKRKISWLCFAICVLFPFTLILYGHSVLDPVISHLTKDEIRHFGRFQKKVAKIVGWGAAATSILTVVILFVVIRTVPNNYPR